MLIFGSQIQNHNALPFLTKVLIFNDFLEKTPKKAIKNAKTAKKALKTFKNERGAQ